MNSGVDNNDPLADWDLILLLELLALQIFCHYSLKFDTYIVKPSIPLFLFLNLKPSLLQNDQFHILSWRRKNSTKYSSLIACNPEQRIVSDLQATEGLVWRIR